MAELVSKVYSEALFEVAKEDQMVGAVRDELSYMVSCLKMYPEFFEVLKMPVINKSDKKSVLTETFEDKVSVEMINFFKTLIDKNRIGDIFDIYQDFNAKVDEFNAVLNISVESVIPLTEDQLDALSEKLRVKTGKNIVITTAVKPELIGGLVVTLGEQIIDGSVRSKLEGMLEGLTQIIV